MGTTAVLAFKGDEPLGGRVAFSLSVLAIATNLLQIGVALFLRTGWNLRRLAEVQVAGDVAFAAFLVYLTGGSDSLFSFMFLLAIVNGGILLSTEGAWGAAALSFFANAFVIVGMQRGFLPAVDPALRPSHLGWEALAQTVFTHGSAFALTAMLAAYAAGQIRLAGRRAEAAESSLQRLHALHDAIVRSVATGIATTDESGEINFLNRSGEEILGRPAEVLRGLSLETIFPSVAAATERDPGRPQRLECTWAVDGRPVRHLGFTVTPLLNEDGRPIGSTAVFQDLTAVRELERTAARTERLAAVGQLAAGLAHELRNPLASLSGSVELLARQQTDEEGRALFDIVLREAARLDRLVSDFLVFARPSQGRRADVDLAVLVGEVLALGRSDPAAAGLSFEADLRAARAFADAGQLKQVVWNLLRNAIDASGGGGGIRLATGSHETPGRVFLRVSDRGPGIEPSLQERIFDPFFTTKDRGTGLGLSTVHRIVEGLEGHIEVASVVGEGTQFTVVLPASP